MTRPDESDYRKLLDGVGRVHAEVDLDRLPGVILEVVASLVPVEHLSYNEVNTHAGRLRMAGTPDAEAAMRRYVPAWVRHMGEHPILREHDERVRLGGQPGVRKISDFLPRRRYEGLGLYRECYRHLDTEYQMVLPVVAADGHTVGVALNRKVRDFSERDRRVLELFQPHLRTAYLNALARARLRRLFEPAGEEQAVKELRYLGLTGREALVMFHVLQGRTAPEIGAALANSPRTVHKHLEHVFAKLGVSTRAAAVARVIERVGSRPARPLG